MPSKRTPSPPSGLTAHHILPRSRGGSDEECNLLPLPKKKHNAWHICFGNDTPEEVVAKMLLTWEITCPFLDGAGPVEQDRVKKRKNAWKVLFGNGTRDEAIQIVLGEFGSGREKFIGEVLNTFRKNHKKNP